MKPEVLYITYDGICDPLGRSQVLPYVAGLSRRGNRMTVLSFEKAAITPKERAHAADLLRAADVAWIPLRYHKKPTVPATAFDVAQGIAAGLGIRALKRYSVIHARSYVAATMARALKPIAGGAFVFDMRGFWADERIESGAWTKGRLYRTVKKVEHDLFSSADHVVSLTHAGKRELDTWPSVGGRGIGVTVIPTCVDLAAFRPAVLAERQGPLTIGYLGSFGGRYLIKEAVELFAEVKRLVPEARLKVITVQPPDVLRAACAQFSIPPEAVEQYAVPHQGVPAELARMHATISLIKPGFASRASCPTKFGESLAAGCPVVVNPGIGDCAEIVRGDAIGVVTDLDASSLKRAAAELVEMLGRGDPASLRARCLGAAEKFLDLDSGIDAYEAIYRSLLERSPGFGRERAPWSASYR